MFWCSMSRADPAAAVALADREIHDVLDKQTAHHVDLYIEYMNTDLIPEPGAQEKIRGLILQKYRDRQPDVIIAAGPAAVQFIVDVHQKEFPGVPIVICGSTRNKSHPAQLDPSFTGAWVGTSIRRESSNLL